MKDGNRGFVSYLILIIIALALLKYFFEWSLLDAIESERGRNTVLYIRQVLDLAWSYLSTPINYVWREVIWPLFNWAVTNLKKP